MRVVITGSSGRLGGAIVRQLLNDRHTVVGVDVRPGPHTTHVTDVRDRGLAKAIAGADALVHTVSLHAPDIAAFSKHDFVDVNLRGTQAVLDAASAGGVPRVVYTSTTSVYGHALEPREAAVWVDETLLPQPRDIYDVTKLAAEELCRLFAQEHQKAIVHCLRVSRFSFDADPHLAVPYCLHRALHVDDAARAHALALRVEDPIFESLNISGATPFKREDVGELLHDASAVLRRRAPGLSEFLMEHGVQLPDRIERVYDSARAARVLGFRPRHSILELLAEEPAGPDQPSHQAQPAGWRSLFLILSSTFRQRRG